MPLIFIFSGDWISRSLLSHWHENRTWSPSKGGEERGKDYNHSTFVDLVLSGLFGFHAKEGDKWLIIRPLLPRDSWSYFCVDQLKYHTRYITLLWDESGSRYGVGAGFKVYVDKVLVGSADHVQWMKIKLSP